ncbi:MAG: phage terminase large subunit [Alphaproteobacteria bacterium]
MNYWYYELLKYDFPTFIGKTLATVNPGARYQPNWHIDLIAEYLEAVRRSEVRRLIINMPPRAMKSTCVSVAWPAWLLAHDPSCRIISASYSMPLSIKHSVDCRLVMESEWYRLLFPQSRLTHDQNQKHKFTTTQRGYRYASSVGGTITGEGGDFLIMDDPMNPAQARSYGRRESVAAWFEHTFASRLDNKKTGGIVLVMQRLHQDDLSGYLLAKGGWEHLSLPAQFSSACTYDFGSVRRQVHEGEPLQANREGLADVKRMQQEMGSHIFAAQYQQQPVMQEGRMVKPRWFGRYTQPPALCQRTVQSWDTAIKSSSQHDATVCITITESEGKSYIRDVAVMRVEYPELRRVFTDMAARWKPDVILVEDKASGQQLLQDMRRETGLPLIGVQPKTDKITRFAAVSALCEAGRLVLPRQAPWLASFEQELFMFPDHKHDDQVDALSQYLDWLRWQSYSHPSLRSV